MSYITKEELKTVAYNYQVMEITEGQDDIVQQAIEAGIEEAEGYLRPNNKKEYTDGRLVYDIDSIFSKTGTARNALLVERIKSLALFHLVALCNVDIIYEKVQDRYDRAVAWFKDVNRGNITLKLPTLSNDVTNPDGTTNDGVLPFRMGSRKKFNHEYNNNPYDYYQDTNQ